MAKALKIVGLAVAAVGIGLATAGFGAVAFTGAITATISTTAIIAVGAAIEVGAGLLAKKGSTTASQTDRLATTIDPRAFRKTVYGHTAFANDLRYEEWFGADQEYCGWIIALASHRIQSLDEVWIKQDLAWSATGGVQPKFVGYFLVKHVVTEGSPSNTLVLSDPDAGKWNTSSRLTGCAYVNLQFRVTGNGKKDTSPFASGLPSRMTFVGRGAMMYDPRRDSTVPGGAGAMRAGDQSTWAYTADDGTDLGPNLPLQILRELLGWRITNPATGGQKLAVGAGLPPRRIDMGSFIVAANIADELANVSAGGTEPKFHGGACLSEGDDLHSRLDMLCAACNGRLRDVNGKLALVIMHNDLAGAATDDGLNDDDVIGAFTWESDPPLDQCVNVVRGKFTDPSSASLYQMIDYPEVRLDSPDGIDRIMTLDLSVAQSASMAQRIVKQVLERRQYQRTFSAPFDIRAWKYQVGDVVPFTFSPLSFDRRLFRVSAQEQGQDGTCVMSLMDENPAIYAWDADDAPPVTAAAPVVYDPTRSPLILAIADAAKTANYSQVVDDQGTKPDNNAVDTRRPSAPFGNTTVGAALDSLGRVSVQVGDIDKIRSDLDVTTINLGDLTQLASDREAEMLARTTLAGQAIGTVVTQQITRTDDTVETLNLLGAKNAAGTAFIFNVNSVTVDGDRTLAQYVASLTTSSPDGSVDSQAQQLQQAITDGDAANAKSIDQVSTRFGNFAAKASFLINARTDASGNSVAQGILALDVNGRVAGMIASNTGSLSTLDLVFDRTRLLRPDGTLLLRAGDANNGQDANAVYMPNVIVDTLAVNTAMIPVRAVASAPVGGGYSSTTGTADPRRSILHASVVVPTAGWLEITASLQQSLAGSPDGPWSMSVALDGVDDLYSLRGGGLEEDSTSSQAQFYCGSGGTHAVDLMWEAFTSIQARERSMFIKFFPFTE
jgi:hypothetical protein